MNKLKVWWWLVWQMLFGWLNWSLANNVKYLWRMDHDERKIYFQAERGESGWCMELSKDNGDWFCIFYATAPFLRMLLRRACKKNDHWISRDQARMAWDDLRRKP